MAQLLVMAVNVTNPNPTIDTRGCWKRGMIVDIRPDDHVWGAAETRPNPFVLLKFPLVPVDRVEKYLRHYENAQGETVRKRLWQIRWNDLPLAARTKLLTTGELTIKARDAYAGAFDYTWAQVRQFFRNLETTQDETEDP